MNDNIIQIDTVRIDRNKPRNCVCEDRHFTIDTTNREVTCECGLVVDPFEALEYITKHYESINDKHRRLNDQAQQWMKEKPHSVMFKELERHYRRGIMLPFCPKCRDMFDYKDISSHGNAEFYHKLEQSTKGR